MESHASMGLVIALVFGICSASMAFVNKAVLSAYNYNFPITLVSLQMLFTILLLEGLRLTKQITLPSFTIERGRSFLLPSVFYAINSVLALSALSGLNIPMYGLIKRCSPVVILLLGTLLLGKGLPSRPVCLSVLMVTLGCFTAGYGDLSFDMIAYLYGFASVFSQSLYLVLVQKSSQTLTATETLHLNSYNTFPLLVICWLLSAERTQSFGAFDYTDAGLVFMVFLVVSMGCLLNFLLFLCTVHNSALTTSLTGVLKSIVQTIIGMFTFGGISINMFTLSGIVMNLSGGVLYSVAKYRDSLNKQDKFTKPTSNGHVPSDSKV